MLGKGIILAMFLKSAGGNWSAAATWSATSAAGVDSVGPPLASTDCIAELASGNVTIDSGAVCRSFDCQGGVSNYTGTATHSASVTLSIGDGTAGTGNRALRFSSGMTYTLGGATSSTLTFVSTSATTQTVELAGKVSGGMIFNATSNGSWSHSDAINCGTGTITITKGTWTANSQAITAGAIQWNNSNTKSITFGTLTATLSDTNNTVLGSTSGTTLSAASATITYTNTTNNQFQPGGGTFGTLNMVASTMGIISGCTFTNINITGPASKTVVLTLNANQTVTGTLTLAGNSATNRLLVTSDTLGTARTITNSGATMTWSNVDFRDIALGTAFDANAITGKSGDCGGNSNITFTTAATRTATFSTSKSASDATIWTGSQVPLPQDDRSMAGVTGGTFTDDMPRSGKSTDWTGATGSPVWAKSTATTIYGSLKMISGMTNSGLGGFTFEGRGAFTLTSAGQTFTNPVTIAMVGGTLTQQDALISSQTCVHTHGTYSLNDFNATYTTFSTSSISTRTLTRGSGTMTCTGTGSVFIATVTTGLTMTATTGTLAVTDVSATAKTVVTGGLTLGILSVTTGGSGTVTLTGAGSFTRLLCPGGSTKSVILPGSTTTTFTGTTPFPSGAAGNLLTFTASAGTATVAFTSQAVCDYISLTDVAASTGPQYAGANSTLSGTTTNWVASAPPSGPGFLLRKNQMSGGFASMGI